ncbi:hypothetical protein BOVATA_029270 [Babesia ovata]|uniref:Uncharacterized protein n=1 Tax=Babesia ovata TaxID=189622 RepID=A0A2H6KEN0_9APIC|nr:uncharacterized protein BOVATA_029270 [Babesia ovata]GBE61434.1 hypothetical protein BOVATA_029270 [Babesia ovata]
MVRGNQDIVANTPRHISMHDFKVAPPHDQHVHSGAGLRAPPFGYDSEMQRHDSGLTGMMAAYNGAGHVMPPITSVNVDNVNHQTDIYARSPVHPRHVSKHIVMPTIAATQSRSYNGGDHANTVPCSEEVQCVPITQMGASERLPNNLRMAENAKESSPSGISNNTCVSVNMPQVAETDPGRQMHLQRMQPLKRQMPHPCNRVLPPEQPHQLHIADMGAAFAKPYAVNVSKPTSGSTQGYTASNAHESGAVRLVAQVKRNASPPQNTNTGDMSVTDTMKSSINKNPHAKWMIMQRLQGDMSLGDRGISQNIHREIPAVQETASHGDNNSVIYDDKENIQNHEADVQHGSVTAMKTCVFYVDSRWKPVKPDQMLHFEFGISSDVYRAFYVFLNELLPPLGVRDFHNKMDFQACEGYDLSVVMNEKLDINNDTVSDTNVLCMVEKLRMLKCAICKRGERRKMLRKSYPERKCAIYSGSSDHELHRYFGSTIVEKESRLLLYHKVLCDRDPIFICGREDRNCKAAMERRYDLYLEISEWRVQVALRRLTDLRERTFQVAFGINARDMMNFIMYIFTN